MRSTPRIELERVHGWIGAASATSILALWFMSLAMLLTSTWDSKLLLFAPLAILAQTFLHTGLFINAHDAMHGTLCHTSPRINNALGALSVFCYALFSFEEMREHHHAHHAHPASEDDPDYCDEPREGPLKWYASFLARYVTWWQLLGMALVFNLLQHGLGIEPLSLVVFWVIPSLLSTVQLFFVGTYLPHLPGDDSDQEHHARSLEWPVWLSFFACYHFGYHLEHHRYPYVPWWLLPRARELDDTSNAPLDATTSR